MSSRLSDNKQTRKQCSIKLTVRRGAVLYFDNPVASECCWEQRCGDNAPCKTGAAFVGTEGHPPDGLCTKLIRINSLDTELCFCGYTLVSGRPPGPSGDCAGY